MWLAEVMEREEQVCAVGAGIQMMGSSWGGHSLSLPLSCGREQLQTLCVLLL